MSNSDLKIALAYDDFVYLNSLLRSCRSVAARNGESTNWEALQFKLETVLLQQQKNCPEGVMRLDAFATAKTFKILQENNTPVSLANARNTTNEVLQKAMNESFDEVFFVGVKNGILSAGWSGYNNIEQKIGALEILKHDMLVRGN